MNSSRSCVCFSELWCLSSEQWQFIERLASARWQSSKYSSQFWIHKYSVTRVSWIVVSVLWKGLFKQFTNVCRECIQARWSGDQSRVVLTIFQIWAPTVCHRVSVLCGKINKFQRHGGVKYAKIEMSATMPFWRIPKLKDENKPDLLSLEQNDSSLTHDIHYELGV